MSVIARKADSKGRIVIGSSVAGDEFWVEQTSKDRWVVTHKTVDVFLQEPANSERRKDYYNGLGFPVPLQG